MPLPFYEIDGATTPGAPTNSKVGKIVDAATSEATAEAPVFLDGTGTFRPVSTTNPMPVTEGTQPARNTYGSASSVAAGGTATVVTFVADASFKVRGMLGTGTADGAWRIKYNGTPHYGTRTTIGEQEAIIDLPNPDAPGAGVTVTVDVTNNGTGVADYECTLFGE